MQGVQKSCFAWGSGGNAPHNASVRSNLRFARRGMHHTLLFAFTHIAESNVAFKMWRENVQGQPSSLPHEARRRGGAGPFCETGDVPLVLGRGLGIRVRMPVQAYQLQDSRRNLSGPTGSVWEIEDPKGSPRKSPAT